MSAEIIGPLTRRVLVVDGYSVPCAPAGLRYIKEKAWKLVATA